MIIEMTTYFQFSLSAKNKGKNSNLLTINQDSTSITTLELSPPNSNSTLSVFKFMTSSKMSSKVTCPVAKCQKKLISYKNLTFIKIYIKN